MGGGGIREKRGKGDRGREREIERGKRSNREGKEKGWRRGNNSHRAGGFLSSSLSLSFFLSLSLSLFPCRLGNTPPPHILLAQLVHPGLQRGILVRNVFETKKLLFIELQSGEREKGRKREMGE